MKILCLDSSPIWLNGLPNGFRDLGHEIKASGPLTKDNIPRIIAEFEPDLIYSVGWGPEHTKIKQDWIRENVLKAKIPHIYWAVEDPHFTETYTLPLLMRMQPDFVFTLSKEMVSFYQSLDIPAAHLDFGFHSSIHRQHSRTDSKYEGNISLVANAYPLVLQDAPNHYRNQSLQILLKPLLRLNQQINIWGRNWEQMEAILGESIPQEWIKGYLSYTDASKVYSSSSIMIGLQNYETQVTQRTYEILASGGFLLTSDIPAVRELFTPGKDLVVSSSPKETLELLNYYLINHEERETIRKQGKASVQPHSYKNRAAYVLECLYKEGILKRGL
ncbi:glycosyltransferase [Lederbergia wuyishanensis]|uniref:Spore maturation protein CgeB n=1 Tax=Lederbergia wuyishanensis TaxID=1347903 RepID=A0ABU0D727_9BACI|nr:glycosyltransferase [Lederbergia wuyishanensis]MCJ8008853.1 glycosyltransferase [Lederbergia wuyishanensis]MDQ0344175.1 spore maturation protein CgeB [Lederbergia wuyishanensis]